MISILTLVSTIKPPRNNNYYINNNSHKYYTNELLSGIVSKIMFYITIFSKQINGMELFIYLL
jgi:hypothetical protein